jgi:hypothetical protein
VDGDLEVMFKNKLAAVIALSVLLIPLVSCSKNPVDEGCPLTVDTTKVLLSTTHKGTRYFLVQRISGWHDKTEIIQLFDKEPKLGKCNEDLVKPVFEDSLERDKTLVKLTVSLKNKAFELSYGKSGASSATIALEFVD